MRNASRWVAAAVVLTAAVHPFLGTLGRSLTYLLSGLIAIPPILVVLRRTAAGLRTQWWLLLAAMCTLSVGNSMLVFAGANLEPVVEVLVTIGHSLLLAAAVALVLRRGRNDIGGMLDVSVAAIGVGGLAWTTVLYPRLQQLHATEGGQISILVSILVLSGVLGALLRVWLHDRRQRAAGYLLTALVLALVGNIVLARVTGVITAGHSGGIELFFMVAYGCVGIAMADRSVDDLVRAGSAPADKLSGTRLALLGLALALDPVAGGMRVLFGESADGPLLAVGSLLITPLVMIRVGRLARQREQAEERLRHQATHDLLTGLPNRADLLGRLGEALGRERMAGTPGVTLLFCDLNGFKAVNDRLGHLAGDRLLTEVGERIGAGLREGDMLARYGGDEFLLVCEDGDQAGAAARLTAYVQSALTKPFRLAGEDVTIGASVGVVISDGSLDADELITRADQEMYRSKQEHKAKIAAGGVRVGAPAN